MSAAASESPGSRPRSAYRLAFDRVFGPFFWARLLSASGVWVHNTVLAIVAFEITGSALAVGLVTAAQFAPQLLLAPLSGKLADRGSPAPQIIAGRLLVAAGSGGLACWLWAVGGVDRLGGVAPLMASALVVGLGLVLGGPAMQSIVPHLIRDGELPAATTLNSVPMAVARGLGPAVGAIVATQLSSATAFGIAAATNLLYAVVMVALRIPPPARLSGDTDLSIRAAIQHVRSDRGLTALLVGVCAVAIGADPSITLAPSLAVELGQRTEFAGALTSAFGVGTGLGLVIFAPARRWLGMERLPSGGLVVMGAGLLPLTWATSANPALGGLCVAGVGMTIAMTGITTQIQERTPDALRGRVMSLWFLGFLGTRPFAATLTGSLADVASARMAIAVTVAATLTVAWLCRRSVVSR